MTTWRSKAWLILVTALAVAAQASAQSPAKNTGPPRPQNELLPLSLPDLTKLEPEVRDQLLTFQASLSTVLKDPSATRSTLAEAYGTMGQIYHAYLLTLPASECYANARLLAPRDFRWVYLLGKIEQREDRVDAAIQRFVEARTLRPDYVPVHVNLGNIFLQMNRLAEAATSFEAALALDTTNAAALYGLGQIALSQRRYADAVKFFEEALKRVPDATKIRYSLALAYRGAGDLVQAKAQLAQQGPVGVRVADPLVDQLPELVTGERVHLIRGRMAFDAKRFQDAAAEFRKAIGKKPDSVSGHLNLGYSLVQMNDLTAAAAEFETVVRLDAENMNARFNLAVVLAKTNKHQEAIGHLQSLLNRNPNDVEARFFLAQEFLKSGRYDEALSEFARVSQADPDNEEALLETVKLLEHNGRYKEAVEHLQTSLAEHPQKTETAATLAYLLAASPQYDLRNGTRAFDLAQRVFQTTGLPQHGAVVALALAELGRCAEAGDWQRKMIALAENQQQQEFAASLKADLRLYVSGASCRPTGR